MDIFTNRCGREKAKDSSIMFKNSGMPKDGCLDIEKWTKFVNENEGWL